MEREHWWFVARGKILMQHLENVLGEQTKLKILNVGAATGRSSELLAQFGEVTSIEYDKDCFEFVKKLGTIEIQRGSILELDFESNSFDLVCAFDVIEHVEDDQLAVDEMLRVAKPSGLVSVTVPAFMFLWSTHDEVNHHYRRYTMANLTQLFPKSNALVFKSYFNFFLFFPIAGFRLLSKLIPKRSSPKEDSGSDFGVMGGTGFINQLFYKIFNFESQFLKRKVKLPVGVSCLATYRKS